MQDDAVTVYIDGGARGNPGPAGYGVRLESSDGTLIAELLGTVGIATNNVAEYRGLTAALAYLAAHDIRKAHIRSDSQLLVRQLLGHYKVRHPGLQPLHAESLRLLAQLDHVTFEHIPRSANLEADRLANRAMDEAAAATPATPADAVE